MFLNKFKLLLAGVAFILPAYAQQYPTEAKATKSITVVKVVWLPSFEVVNVYCSYLGQRPVPTPPATIVGCYDSLESTIYAVEPDSFNDHERLEILGHEFWHALGAEHP